jgi:hypothetical protein
VVKDKPLPGSGYHPPTSLEVPEKDKPHPASRIRPPTAIGLAAGAGVSKSTRLGGSATALVRARTCVKGGVGDWLLLSIPVARPSVTALVRNGGPAPSGPYVNRRGKAGIMNE